MHTRAYAVHIPTPSRTRPPQHEPSTPPTHRPRRSCPAWARNLARTPAASRVSGTAPANTNTSKASQLPEEPRWPRQPAGAEYEKPLPTHVDEAPPARRAGRIASQRRACVRSFGSCYTAVGTIAYPIRRIRACVRARGLYLATYLPCAIYLCCAGYRVALLRIISVVSRLAGEA
jgi:hypothetical protein